MPAPNTNNESNPTAPALSSDNDLLITRTFNAPRDLVWKIWTDPALAHHWTGPKGFTLTSIAMDLKVGGKFRMCIRSPEGKDRWMEGVYWEISPPEKLVYTFAWDLPHKPRHDTLITATFTEDHGKTRLTFHHAPMLSAADRDSHAFGWNSFFDRFEEYLATVALGGSPPHRA